MKKDSNQKSIKMFKAGQPVVLIGETTHEREIFIFNTPVNFVETLRSAEKVPFKNNQEFMESVSKALNIQNTLHVNFHNEESFIESLIRYGICIPATLN
jgi:hypothetical protein